MHKERKFPISVSYVKCRLLVEAGEGGSLPSGALGVDCFYFGNLGGGGRECVICMRPWCDQRDIAEFYNN